MAAITSAGTGNWNVGGTWVGGVAPGDGDTATIASGHTVTIPAGVTVTVGSSPATGGTAAITGTGILVVNGTLNIKGDAAMTNSAGTTFGAGFVLNIIVPTGTQYNFKGGTTYTNYSPLIFNGTSGSRGTVTATLTGTGVATLQGGGANSNGFIQATYTDFSNLGSASVKAVNCYYNGTRTFSLSNCSVSNCGLFYGNNMADGDSLILANTEFKGSLGTYSIDFGVTATRTSGTRSITFCVFDKMVKFGLAGYTIRDTWFGDAYYESSSGSAKAPTTWVDNYFGKTSGAGVSVLTPFGLADTYVVVRDSNSYAGTSIHGIDPSNLGVDTTVQRCVFDGVCVDTVGDWILPSTSAAPASSYYLNVYDNVYLNNPLGVALGTPLTLYGNAKLKIRMRRNTYPMGVQGMSYGESGGYSGYAGMVEQFVSNLAWNGTQGSTGWKVWDALGPTFDAAAGIFTLADYNGGWNFSTTTTYASPDAVSLARGYQTGSSAGSNYAFQAGTTPGDHDVNADPQFRDSTRCLATFDQDYIGKAIGTAWASGTAYSVGDIVSASTTGVWGSRSINYRCILAHTSSTGSSTLGKPGAATAGSPTQWSTRWELASDYWIRQLILAGTTYTDASIGASGVSIIGVLRRWVIAGFSPTNTAYKGTGYTGEDIGAVPVAVLGTVPYGNASAMTGGFSALGF